MPTRPKKRRKYLPNESEPFSHKGKSKLYRTNRWTKASLRYRKDNPLCEVHKYYGQVKGVAHTDHVIKVNEGGAKYDRKNLMSLCVDCHSFKTSKEKQTPILIEWDYNDGNEKIPTRREDIFKMYEKRFI